MSSFSLTQLAAFLLRRLSRLLAVFPLRQIFVEVKARRRILLRFSPEVLRVLRLALGEHLEARFHLHEILRLCASGVRESRISGFSPCAARSGL